MTELNNLPLNQTLVTDSGLKHLQDFKQLKRIDLEDTQVADAGLVHLERLPHLTHLNVRGTMVSLVGVMRLEIALPECKTQSDFDRPINSEAINPVPDPFD